ncbi:MAG: glycosyltransferase family 2 protein [Bacteroidales bacterium]|nr:glycosyltransferase family 2 protein [Bacteroidales bacterium]
MKTFIIIPCYNEEKRLPLDKFKAFVEQHTDCSLLFVNDGSKDNTLRVLNRFAEEHPVIKVLDLPKNSGKAEAVRQGILHAIDSSPTPDFVAFYDADMATPAEDLYAMIELIKAKPYHAVIGSRILRLGGNIERTFMRGIASRIFANVASRTLRGLRIYDTQCGAKIFRTSVAQLIFEKPFITNWIFDVELFARMIKQYGMEAIYEKVYEFPLTAWHDVHGSKIKKMDFFRQILDMYKIKKHYRLP